MLERYHDVVDLPDGEEVGGVRRSKDGTCTWPKRGAHVIGCGEGLSLLCLFSSKPPSFRRHDCTACVLLHFRRPISWFSKFLIGPPVRLTRSMKSMCATKNLKYGRAPVLLRQLTSRAQPTEHDRTAFESRSILLSKHAV